jgi:DNA-binding SARP family transcriptional activator/TolB-like protein
MFVLRTLGPVDLSNDEGHKLHTVVAQPKRLALLVYLALARPRGGLHRRDSLIALFWPEATADRARAALSQALTFLRRALGEQSVTVTGTDEVGLHTGIVRCDVVDFEAALQQGEHERALALYTGDLLEAFHVDDAPGFERWLERERQALRTRALEAARSLATASAARGDYAHARTWVDWTLSRLSADDEGGLRDVLTLLDGVGDRAAALRAYGAFACRLREEYDLAPSPETERLVSRIKSGASQRPATVAPSETIAHRSPPPASTEADPPDPHSLPRIAGVPGDATESGSPRTRRRAALGVAALFGIIALPLVIANSPERDVISAVSPTRVVVAPFDNATGDSAFAPLGRIAADWVTGGLTRTGLADVVDPASALAAARSADSALHDGRRGTEWLRAVGRDARAGVVVSGSYYRVNDSLHLSARVVHGETGEVLRSVDPVRVLATSPMEGLEQLRTRLMGALASLIETRAGGLIVPASTPPTYEAYRAYIEGLELFSRVRYAAALPHFERAARLDTTFTLPLLWAAMAHGNSGNLTRQDSLLARLSVVRDRLAPADRHGFDALVARRQGDVRAELRALRQASALAPLSNWTFMLGARALNDNRPREAITALTRLDPSRGWVRGWAPYWIELSGAYHRLGDHRTELASVRSARREFPEVVHLRGREAVALAALGRTEDVDRIIAPVVAAPIDTMEPGPIQFMEGVAIEYLAHGRHADGRRMAERCAAWAGAHSGAYGAELGRAAGRANCAYLAGRLAEAESLYALMSTRAALDPRASSRLHLMTAYSRLGVIAAQRGNRDAALRRFKAIDSLARFIPGPEVAVLPQVRIAAALANRDMATQLLHRAAAAGIVLAWHGDHNIDYAPLRGLAAFEALTQLRDKTRWEAMVGRLRVLAPR